MEFTRKLAVAAATAMMAAVAAPAGAQAINFSTTGQFTGGGAMCDMASAALVATCGGPDTGDMGALGLSFTGVSNVTGGFMSGSQVKLGTFQPFGTGSVSTVPSSVMFRLFINQTDPTTGQGSVVGGFTGTFSQFDGTPNNSTLVYKPNQTTTIGSVEYSLIFDTDPITHLPRHGILINAVNSTSVGAIATVPEPSSMALLGTGLVGLVPMIRRRKNKA